jgi:hypothetical protein
MIIPRHLFQGERFCSERTIRFAQEDIDAFFGRL